jgi:hypothetical protein
VAGCSGGWGRSSGGPAVGEGERGCEAHGESVPWRVGRWLTEERDDSSVGVDFGAATGRFLGIGSSREGEKR